MAIIYRTFCSARTVFYAAFALFLLASNPAIAQDDLYTVDGVKVDVTADSALTARDQALDKAQVDAFTILAGRMLPESEIATFKAPDIATVSGMVQDYEVTAEKLSSVRYIGTYKITFRQKSVDRFFNVAGTSFTNAVSTPIVVLPFYDIGNRTYLWSPYNVWMKAWNRAPAQGTPVPLIVPMGDLEDVSDIGDDEMFGYNPTKLAALLQRYGAGEAALIVARPDAVISSAQEGDQANGGTVTVNIYRTDEGAPEQVKELIVMANPGETVFQVLNRAVLETQAALRNNWKEKTVVAAPAVANVPLGNMLVARVKIASLEQWASAQKSLARVNVINSTVLKSLTPREALVEMSYRGDETTLRTALATAGMTLSAPQYAPGGYDGSPASSRLVYDLSLGAPAPVMQVPNLQQPAPRPVQQPAGYNGGYQSPRVSQPIQRQNIQPSEIQPAVPREQITDPAPNAYPIKPRNEGGYTGRF